MDTRLTALLEHPLLWQTGMSRAPRASIATGFSILDERLPGHGWPAQGLIEILSAAPGRSELLLLAPALSAWLGSTQGWIALVAPPFEPYAPAFSAMQLPAERVLVMRTPRFAWTLEQAVRSGAFRCVLAWPQRIQHKCLRRLQVAAKQASTLLVLGRHLRCHTNVSPAVLRVQMEITPSSVELDIFKSRGGKAGRIHLPRFAGALDLN